METYLLVAGTDTVEVVLTVDPPNVALAASQLSQIAAEVL